MLCVAAPLAQIENNLGTIVAMQDFVLQTVLPLLLVNPAQAEDELETELKRVAADPSVASGSLTEFLDVVGCFKDSILQRPVNWSFFSSSLSDAKSKMAMIRDEFAALPNPRPKGRPFGHCNIKRSKSPDAGHDGAQPTKKKKGSKSKEKKDKKESDPDEPPFSGDPFADLEAEQKPSNKHTMIPLYKKYIIVKFAKDLAEAGTVQNVEKEVMCKFHKYFWSEAAGKYKTGLLSKWTKILAVVGCRSEFFFSQDFFFFKGCHLFAHLKE